MSSSHFDHFTVLQHVRLPADALLGPNPDEENQFSRQRTLSTLLTTSLVTLDITLNSAWDLRRFMDSTSCPRGWLAESGSLPNLESFAVHHDEKDDAMQKAGSDLVQSFEDAGIKLVVSPP